MIIGLESVGGLHIFIGAVSDSNRPLFLNLLSLNPQSCGRGIPKTKNKKTDMKKLIVKMLGLDTLVTAVLTLRKENEELKTKIENLETHISEMDVPNMDEWVLEDDINDRIESYLNDNDYATQSYCDDEIESKVSDAVESAIEDLDIDEKVRDLFNDASPAPMSEQEIKDEITRSLRAMFLDELEVKIKLK